MTKKSDVGTDRAEREREREIFAGNTVLVKPANYKEAQAIARSLSRYGITLTVFCDEELMHRYRCALAKHPK